MKKILIFVLAVMSVTAYADKSVSEQGKGQRDGVDRIARMQEHLGLSNEQVEQIREIRKNGGGRDEIRAVLSDEQRVLAKEHKGNMKGKGKGKHSGKGGSRNQDNAEN